tara:strand:- start:9690 stop:9905 length:216 start_codon:yes stop_codon:yes gene_type:complete
LREGIKDIEGEVIQKKLELQSGIKEIKVGQIFYVNIDDDVANELGTEGIENFVKEIFVNDLLYDCEIYNVS